MSVHPVPIPRDSSIGGAHPGQRLFADIGGLDLERGGHLPDVTVAYETWGALNAAADNAVLIEHALTGDSHVIGSAGPGHPTPGWWEGLIGPGAPLDTDRLFVVATNVLGGCRGTTGPASAAPDGRPWGSRYPVLTIRDQVAAEAAVADLLGVRRWAAVIGGSMGGMRALEWAVTHPERVARCVVLAATAAATADQIGWCQSQLLAITSDPDFAGGDYYGGRWPLAGMGLARRIAHLTYRSEEELSHRFGRDAQPGEEPLDGRGRYAVESYLDHHAEKLTARFDPNSYLVLTAAMNSHDVGRGRGGIDAALARVRATCVIVDVDTDRCYPPRLSDELAAAVPGAIRRTIRSRHGHDGFLTEVDQAGALFQELLGDGAT